MEPTQVEEPWFSSMKSMFSLIEDAGLSALTTVSNAGIIRSTKLRTAWLTDEFTRQLTSRIPESFEIPSGGGDLWVVVDGLCVLRVKSASRTLAIRNISTDRYRAFLENANLPGIPAALARLELCYVLDPSGVDFVRLALTQRDGDGIQAHYDLPWRGSPARGTEALNLELDTPKPKVTPKKTRRRREGTSDT